MKENVRGRAESLPNGVWDCEACGSEDSIQIRRSSLNEQFFADDISFKCMECWHFRTHGVPFDDPDVFGEELSDRDGRVVDFARDGNDVRERLAALGYLGKAKTHE